MLINLAVNYSDLKGPSFCCGCSKKTQSAFLGAIQITLIVCAILAIAKVGSFENIGNLRAVLIAAGSFVLVTDIVLTVLHRRAIPSGQKLNLGAPDAVPPPAVTTAPTKQVPSSAPAANATQETDEERHRRIRAEEIAATKAKIQIRKVGDSYQIDLTRLAEGSSDQSHVYPVFAFSEKRTKHDELCSGQFFFYFEDENNDLSNVMLYCAYEDGFDVHHDWVSCYLRVTASSDVLAKILEGKLTCPFEAPQPK